MEKPLDFVQFDVIYTRQRGSNRWTRKIERKIKPIGGYTKEIALTAWKFEDENSIVCIVNIKCDPRLYDPTTFGIVPEEWQPYEEEAFKLTDKEFQKRHPEVELTT